MFVCPRIERKVGGYGYLDGRIDLEGCTQKPSKFLFELTIQSVLVLALLALFFSLRSVADTAGELGPFGLAEFVEPDAGPGHRIWNELRKVTAEFEAEEPRLDLCAKHPEDCTVGERELENIIRETEKVDGLAQIEVVNKLITSSFGLYPTSRSAQYFARA